ncbi:MAG: Tex-like N-terminal domain-containing protein [Bilophila wadsworthia]
MQNYASIIAQELNIRPQQTEAVIRLLDEDATVPFIARYRKEATGSLDEVAVTAIRDRLAALKELDKRREAILASLEERGLLTPELRAKVEAADALTVLEDIYLSTAPSAAPAPQWRRSAASNRWPISWPVRIAPPRSDGRRYERRKGVPDAEAALAGARDISGAPRISPPANACVNSSGAKDSCEGKAVSGKEGFRRRQVPRLFRYGDEPAAQAPSTVSSPCSGAKRKASCAPLRP